jgi:hypothetical protein
VEFHEFTVQVPVSMVPADEPPIKNALTLTGAVTLAVDPAGACEVTVKAAAVMASG